MTTNAEAGAAPDPESDAFADQVETAGARAFRGSVWQISNTLAPYIFTTFVSVVAARVLGPDGMGRQSFISFVVLTTTMVCLAGFPATVPRYIAELLGRRRERVVPSLVSRAWQFGFVMGAIGAGALLIAAARGAEPRAAWIFGAIAVAAGVLHKVPGAVLTSTQRWRQHAVVVLSTGAAATVATLITLLLGGGITGIFVVAAVANVIMLLWAAALSHRLLARIKGAREPLGVLGRQILRFGAIASVPMILSFVVYQRSEFFFLEHSSSDTQIALYSIAFSAYSALLAFPSALAIMVTPAVATLYGAGELGRIRSGYARAARLLFLVSLPLAAGALVLGPTLLRLVYGDQYSGTGDVLLVLTIPLVLSPIGGLSSGTLIGRGRITAPVVSTSVSAAVDLGLAALLVPRLDAVGAAVANASAQLTAVAISTTLAIRLIGRIHVAPRHLVKAVACAAVGGGCAWLVLYLLGHGVGPFVLATAVGAATFVGMCLSLRVLPREDAEWIASATGGREGRATQWVGRAALRLAGVPLGAT
jgi:O-antigen/teichoic acid export membrane protein